MEVLGKLFRLGWGKGCDRDAERRWAVLSEAFSGADRPSGVDEQSARGVLLRDGDPHIESGAPMGGDALAGELVEECGPALAIGVGGGGEQDIDLWVGPEGGHDALEEVADPPGAQQTTSLDAGDGRVVAGNDGEAKVWS